MPTRLLCPQDSPGKNTGVSCHVPLPGDSVGNLFPINQAVVPKQHTRSTPPASPLLGKPPPALPDKFILASHSSHGGWVSSAKAYTRQTALTVISYFPRHTRALEGGTDGHPPFLPLTPSCSIFSSAVQVASGQRPVLVLL